MKNFFVSFALFSALIFVVSCGGNSKSSDNSNGNESSNICKYGEYECHSGDSYFCGYSSGDDLMWIISDECRNGCDEQTGKCTQNSEPDDPDDPDTTPEEEPDKDNSKPDDDGDTSKPDNDTDNGDSTHDDDADTATSDDDADSAPEENDDDADTATSDDDADTPTEIELDAGIYLGILGFNDSITIRDIEMLKDSNVNKFNSFIMDKLEQTNSTALLFGVRTALLDMMKPFPVTEDMNLKHVALITFTDGLDNISTSFNHKEFNPDNYQGDKADELYLEALHDIIVTQKIPEHSDLKVDAYTIGIKGGDVNNKEKFTKTLKLLASNDKIDEETGETIKYFYEAENIDAVNTKFRDLAKTLSSVSKEVNLDVKVNAGNARKFRFTFDLPKTANLPDDSQLYIEANFNNSTGTLENVNYVGFVNGANTIPHTPEGSDGYAHYIFNDVRETNGTPLSDARKANIRFWKLDADNIWSPDSEFENGNSSKLIPIKSSALIVLALDCTNSLKHQDTGINDFDTVQTAAKDFIKILLDSSHTPKTAECTGLPANAQWNTASEILQTWNGSSYSPTTTGSYNETPSTEYCRFKCKSGYSWNGYACTVGGTTTLPECSSSSTTPCKDSSSSLTWSSKSTGTYIMSGAYSYCNNYSEGGLSGWHLPDIDELRTLITNCSGTQTGGSCSVSDPSCLIYSECWVEAYCYACGNDTNHSKLNDTGILWSNSYDPATGNEWVVDFNYGDILTSDTNESYYIRCVR